MSVKTCEQCGTEFGPKKHDGPKKWAARRFCTVACSRASLRGKPSRNKKHVNTGPCSVDWCDRKAVARGMCKRHWTQWRRSGDPQATAKPRKTDPKPKREFEPLVLLGPDSTPVPCPDCGRIISATDDPVLLACALDNHARYCQAKKKEKAA